MADTTGKKLSQLTNDNSAANDDEILVFKGDGVARRVTKSEFLSDRDNTINTLKAALLSFIVKTGSTKVGDVPASGNVTLALDIGLADGYTSQLANLARFLISVPTLNVVNSYYDGSVNKLMVVIGNSTNVVQTGAILFYSIPSFNKKGLA